MGENSKIEWCNHTFNPWIGCTKVSEGCAHCYAENSTPARVLRHQGHETWGRGAARRLSSDDMWKQPLKWNRHASLASLNWEMAVDAKAGDSGPMPTRPRVFCASLADWLDDQIPLDWLARLLNLIRLTPHLDWLLFTKRPQNFQPRLTELLRQFPRTGLTLDEAMQRQRIDNMLHGWQGITYSAPEVGIENYWIGTTVENQARADERIPQLLSIPAKVRFLSCGPCSDPWRFSTPKPAGPSTTSKVCAHSTGSLPAASPAPKPAPKPAPCTQPGLALSEINAPPPASPSFFKQWGNWFEPKIALQEDEEATDSGEVWMVNIGKAKAGRLLDGHKHNGFPTP